MQNQIYKRAANDAIKTGQATGNSPNYIDYNETVNEETVVEDRHAGCYIPDGHERDFILHGESITILKENNGQPTNKSNEYTCNNGELVAQPLKIAE